ncbi:MAG: arginase [Candidatus Nitrosocaldaceae archaeon]|nr:MAG: arginase [Candidatus Nitrosocaldaceae archaeon]
MSYIDLYMQDNSLTQGNKEPDLYLFGVPFDSTCSYRPGTRFGPNAIREAFKNIEYNSYYNDKDIKRISIKDLGNTRFTVNAEYMLDMVNKVANESISKGFTCILGGEHLITLGSYMATKESSLVIFDAHYDLRDEFTDTRYSHATFLRRIVEQRGSDNILHIGARGYGSDELEFLENARIASIKARDINDNIIKDHISVLDDELYISIDLDAIDPAFAPGVGTPEPLGLNVYQFFNALKLFNEHKVKAFDIVELSPPYDNGNTAILAAKIMLEIINMNLD